jgi:CRP-like cAMP-binding protein
MIMVMSLTLAPIFELGALRRLAAGEPLFHAGDPVHLMFLVTEGQVSLVRQTAAGSPLILQQAKPGQVLAEASAYSPHYHCGAQASGEAALLSTPVRRFRERCLSEPALTETWVAHLANAVQEARLRAEIRSLRTTAERLDAWLGEGRALPVKGQWQDLAGELGVTREALYRELAKRRSPAARHS